MFLDFKPPENPKKDSPEDIIVIVLVSILCIFIIYACLFSHENTVLWGKITTGITTVFVACGIGYSFFQCNFIDLVFEPERIIFKKKREAELVIPVAEVKSCLLTQEAVHTFRTNFYRFYCTFIMCDGTAQKIQLSKKLFKQAKNELPQRYAFTVDIPEPLPLIPAILSWLLVGGFVIIAARVWVGRNGAGH